MVGLQSRFSSPYASALGAGSDEEKEAGASELVSTYGGCPEANLAHHTISVLLRSRPPRIPPFSCNGGDDSL